MHMCSICTDDILSVLGISTVNFMPSHAMAKSALNARMEKNAGAVCFGTTCRATCRLLTSPQGLKKLLQCHTQLEKPRKLKCCIYETCTFMHFLQQNEMILLSMTSLVLNDSFNLLMYDLQLVSVFSLDLSCFC